ncbi:MAG: hypothetical protein KAT65_00400 [Methanophagales archaeon]|nr:hypothetical protein [Methanophagales archaeon]
MADTDSCAEEQLTAINDNILTKPYRKKLNDIRKEVCKEWNVARNLIYFIPHGVEHSKKVESGIHELLKQNKNKFSEQEWFLLLASAWLHDIGMIPGLFNDDKKTPEWDMVVREEHHNRSSDYVNKRAEKYWGLNRFERRALASMCEYHRKTMDLHEITEEKNIRVRLLCAYLRLADAIHIDRIELNQLKEYQTYLMLGMDIESKFHWLKAKYADDVSTDPENFKLVITLKQPKAWKDDSKLREDMEPLCTVFIEEIKDEIEQIKEILMQGKLAIYLDVEAKIVSDSEVDSNELTELLRGINLWSSPNAGMAINSVLNAIGSFDTIEDLENYKQYLTSFLSKRPCHVYLDKIQKKLGTYLGNKISEQEKIENIKHYVEMLKKEREFANEELTINARPFLINGMPLLLYGNSGSVLLALTDLPNDLKANMKIYVCECSTKNQYRFNNRLQYCDGIRYSEKVKNLGFNKNNVIVVPDSSVSFLFKNRKVAKVFFGANGIRKETGEMGHSLGHLTIADAADRNKIPVYVIAEFRKIGEFKPKPELQRKGDWLTTDRAYTLNGFKTFNPLEDIVPADRIKFLITELGAIPAERLPSDYEMIEKKRQLNLQRIEQ